MVGSQSVLPCDWLSIPSNWQFRLWRFSSLRWELALLATLFSHNKEPALRAGSFVNDTSLQCTKGNSAEIYPKLCNASLIEIQWLCRVVFLYTFYPIYSQCFNVFNIFLFLYGRKCMHLHHNQCCESPFWAFLSWPEDQSLFLLDWDC